MAVVKNKTGDVLALFRSDAPPVDPGGEVTISDAAFVERAWPTSTWDVVTAPELDGYVDASTEDAHLWVVTPGALDGWAADHPFAADGRMSDPGAFRVEEVVEYLEKADDAERVRVIALESAGKARKTILEWSDN